MHSLEGRFWLWWNLEFCAMNIRVHSIPIKAAKERKVNFAFDQLRECTGNEVPFWLAAWIVFCLRIGTEVILPLNQVINTESMNCYLQSESGPHICDTVPKRKNFTLSDLPSEGNGLHGLIWFQICISIQVWAAYEHFWHTCFELSVISSSSIEVVSSFPKLACTDSIHTFHPLDRSSLLVVLEHHLDKRPFCVRINEWTHVVHGASSGEQSEKVIIGLSDRVFLWHHLTSPASHSRHHHHHHWSLPCSLHTC